MIIYSKMNTVSSVENNNKDDKIETILNMLRNQVDQCNTVKEDKPSEPELTTDQRIQQLVMEEKQLSTQFQKVRKELRHYERKYEKALMKKVRRMKIQIKEDCKKLKEIKQKYFELYQLDTEPSKLEILEGKKSEEASNSLNVNTLSPQFNQNVNTLSPQFNQNINTLSPQFNQNVNTLSPQFNQNVNALSPQFNQNVNTLSSQFNQNDISLSRKIKISIKKNESSSEIHFVHDINGQNAFTNLVELVKPITLNTRECRIILQKLTEEQINRYIDQKRLSQPEIEYKEITQDCLQKINESIVCPNWHIKIPRSVFEESQKESRKSISEESQKENRKSISEESQKENRKSISEESQNVASCSGEVI